MSSITSLETGSLWYGSISRATTDINEEIDIVLFHFTEVKLGTQMYHWIYSSLRVYFRFMEQYREGMTM